MTSVYLGTCGFANCKNHNPGAMPGLGSLSKTALSLPVTDALPKLPRFPSKHSGDFRPYLRRCWGIKFRQFNFYFVTLHSWLALVQIRISLIVFQILFDYSRLLLGIERAALAAHQIKFSWMACCWYKKLMPGQF